MLSHGLPVSNSVRDEIIVGLRQGTDSNPLLAFKVALHENLKRKPLTDPEVASAIKEYDELARQIYGDARRGERTDLTSAYCAEVWTQHKTAIDLGVLSRLLLEGNATCANLFLPSLMT